ncbi:DUF2752 domain-containing protein [uncultured Winogradskyella sp.]|jgi:hypothetical protein|uniref:DUF2752 domain-containing protein n=1 Tax=uncultured Winogradskyella sp. TaxID=395353 RepID=UPI0025F6F0E7|nr:DUF2752 domain-containing protein [uncultured Winogradskyella sp.]
MKRLALQLEDYMLPCMWKKNFGIDCLGCGMQRSFNFLLQGEFIAALHMYPAIYTLIIMFAYLILHLKFKFKYGHRVILSLFSINISIIVINFIIKTF